MPSRKKKYNARFPAGRIKKIMQSDEEIGKVAKAVPVIISKTLELFVETLLAKTLKITNSRNAKTLSPSHMKQCIMSEKKFDFLRDLVKNIPDISVAEEAANYHEEDAAQSSPDDYPDSDTPYDLSMPSTSARKTLTRIETQLNGSSSSGSSGNVNINVSVGGCSNMELKRSLSQNGYISNNRAAGQLKRESDIVQRLQQRIESIANDSNAASSSSSVIKHTTSLAAVNSDYLPNKLARSESTPTPIAIGIGSTNNINNRSPLKESIATAVTTMQNSTPTKLQQQNAIPAPIVSFDFCNKPVVKIDYSNLPLTATGNTEMISATPIAPLSAPAHFDVLHQTKSAFDFNAPAPVINIDLSKIVPPIACNADVNTPSTTTPAIATITIGDLSAAARTAEKKINSKVSELISPPSTISTPIAAGVPCNVNTSTTNSTSLELDEDYDNI